MNNDLIFVLAVVASILTAGFVSLAYVFGLL